MIKLKADCGAVEGQVVNTALLKALDHVRDGEAGQIHIDGVFRLGADIYRSFLSTQGAKRHHLIISGEGAASQLIPDFPGNQRAITLNNLESLTLRDFMFSGDRLKNPATQYDCGLILVLGTINQVIWDNVSVYGISSPKENGYGLFWVENCGFEQRGGQVRGCTAVGSSIFTFRRARKTRICGPGDVIDYGMNDAWYAAKTSIGFSHSWYRFIDPLPGEAYLGMPTLEHLTLDEAARYGVSCDGGTGWMRGVVLRDVSVNVREAGLKLNRVVSPVLEDVCFTYRGGVAAIDGTDVLRPRLTRCIPDAQNLSIRLRGQGERLTLDESEGFTLDIPPTMQVVRLPAKQPKTLG